MALFLDGIRAVVDIALILGDSVHFDTPVRRKRVRFEIDLTFAVDVDSENAVARVEIDAVDCIPNVANSVRNVGQNVDAFVIVDWYPMGVVLGAPLRFQLVVKIVGLVRNRLVLEIAMVANCKSCCVDLVHRWRM